MKRVVTITKNEKATLEALINCLYAEAGFSDVEVRDIATVLGWSMNKVKGEIGSLCKKGITEIDPDFGIIILRYNAYGLHPEWRKELAPSELENEVEVQVN